MAAQHAFVSNRTYVPWRTCTCIKRRLGRPRQRPLQVQAADQGGRQSWDFGRFIKTVTYFNEPPTPEQVFKTIAEQPAKLVRQLTGTDVEDRKSAVMTLLTSAQQGSQPSSSGAGAGADVHDVILVAGATGGVGKRVVERILKRGKHVRALVRDLGKARSMLGNLAVQPPGQLDLVAADITQPATLQPELFAGVRSVICCTAVKVAPKEGDNANRDKYYQGIKFYDPEIVGQTPEAVEFRGIASLVQAVKEHVGLAEGKLIFSANGQGVTNTWGPLDDVVMGGVSESGFELKQTGAEDGGPVAVFSGLVSSANNGGFASIRTRNLEPPLDLGVYEGLQLRVMGNGQRFKCTIRTDTFWDSVGWTKSFDTQNGKWHDVYLPFKDFIPVFRAKSLKDGSRLNPSTVCSIQLMLSKFEYDGQLNPHFQTGPFKLPFMYIQAYPRQPVKPKFVLVSSAGVTRPGRPGMDLSAEPPAVRLNDELGGILTYKLAGEDVIRSSGIPYTVVRPCALTEEPEGAELVIEQGDNIKGKVSREDVAELCIALLDRPEALGSTFEVKSNVPFSQPFTVDSAKPPPARNWQVLLQQAKLQPPVTGKPEQQTAQ